MQWVTSQRPSNHISKVTFVISITTFLAAFAIGLNASEDLNAKSSCIQASTVTKTGINVVTSVADAPSQKVLILSNG